MEACQDVEVHDVRRSNLPKAGGREGRGLQLKGVNRTVLRC